MNRRFYRLVFDRRRGMRVAVAECARRCVRAATGGAVALAAAGTPAATPAPRAPVTFASKLPAPAAPLPQPYGTSRQADGTFANPTPRPFAYDPAKGPASADLAKTGQVSWTVDGKTATLDQGSVARVVLNWDRFDIGAGYTVRFRQNPDPAVYVSALNRIWSADPSVILGSIQADREVVLLNANGVYFGRTARVDTGRFIAGALNLADAVFEKGLRNVTDGSVVFGSAAADGYAATNLDAAVSVEAGAELRAAAGGDVLLVAPRVVNQGRIETPSGQTVLAAGDKVYLMSSSDPRQRGLIVAVDPARKADGSVDASLGVAENSMAALSSQLNEIRAESGTVNLVGLTVRQNGNINATTAVKGANGAIYLQAMASTVAVSGDAGDHNSAARGIATEAGTLARFGAALGTVEIGPGSVTAVMPEASVKTQIDAEVFNPSRIHVEGRTISVAAGAKIQAPSGRIELLASENAGSNPIFFSDGDQTQSDASSVTIAPGALLSTAGLQGVAVDGLRYQGTQRLFRIELADAPVQRSGPLYRAPVYFDLRDSVKVRLADVSGAVASLARTAQERSTAGGSIDIQADGSLSVAGGAKLDVSGGSVQVSAATLRTTLVDSDGHALSFAGAAAATRLDGVLSTTRAIVSPAYMQGADGGSLRLNARSMRLAGEVMGTTTLGQRQLAGQEAAAAPATLEIGRHVGSVYYLGGIALGGSRPETSVPDATLSLSLDRVAAGGFGRLLLRATRITQPQQAALDLGPGGTLDIDAGTASLDGRFSAAGGRIAVATTEVTSDADRTGTGDLVLSASTVLDASGRWRNDTIAGDAAALTRPQVDGGSVSLDAAHSLLVAPGATLDVSAGARLSAAGSLSTGRAGTINVSASKHLESHYGPGQVEPRLTLSGVALRGFDFGAGGNLLISAPELTVATHAVDGFTLAPDFFGAGGFGSIAVNGLGGVRFESGSTVAPRLATWQLAEAWRAAPSGAMSQHVASPQVLDSTQAERRPVSLSFAATRPMNTYGGADIVVERGASIELDPGASLALSATGSLSVGATGGSAGRASRLVAPGGTLALSITGQRGGLGDLDLEGFVPAQALWLGADARLLVDGTVQRRGQPGPSGVATGTLWGGGSIRLDAARGYVVAEAGSVLSMDGASAELPFTGAAAPVRVAKAAGTLAVSTPEGFVLDGRVSAQAPRDTAGQVLADGGQLQLAVGVGGVDAYQGDKPTRRYPAMPRLLSVGAYDGLLAQRGARFGSDLAAALGNGTGYVRSSMLQSAGLGGLQLAAGDAIRFDGSFSIGLSGNLLLNAPAIAAAPGAEVALAAGFARIGDQVGSRRTPADTGARADASTTQDTRLAVEAGTVEVVGNLGLQGFSSVRLDAAGSAAGEIRFSAYAPSFGNDASRRRQLSFDGSLTMAASQLYATSATDYTIAGGAGSRLVVAGSGSVPAPPLSAFGSLTLKAADIEQGGVLRQPFGHIGLVATGTLKLGVGSLTSVSGQGAAELFGQTINLGDWSLPGGASYAQLPLAKGVDLSAAHIDTAATALVSAGGGGMLRAWEFFPGVGGSSDYLASPGLYAVLPDYAGAAAVSTGGALLPAPALQQIVVTMPGSGLAPGRYMLLPARFALLAGDLPQGAFIVSRAADQASSLLKAALARDDGSSVVTGYLSSPGSVTVGAPGERFVVEPASTFLARSEYRLSDVSTLLASRAAARADAVPALPRDGGSLLLKATGSRDASAWRAQLDLAASGGRAGTLDLSAPQVALLADAASTPAGTFGIGAVTLAASGAGSVLLGGQRLAAADAGSVHVDASGTERVSVDLAGQPLKIEELLLAASGRIELAPDTQIAAGERATMGARTLLAQGAGALLALSADAIGVQRSAAGSGSAGTLLLGARSVLTGKVLALDGTGGLQMGARAQLNAQALTLAAGSLLVGGGAAPGSIDTPLAGDLLARAWRADELTLRGYRQIGFAGAGSGEALPRSLVLDTPLLRGLAESGATVQPTVLRAQDLTLQNTTGAGAAEDAAGSGAIRLQALPPLRYGRTGGLTIGPGSVQAAFDAVQLASAGDIVLAGSGGLVATGSLSLSAARVTAATGAERTLSAAGALQLSAEPGSRTLGESLGSGARLQLAGARVQQDGRLELPGGEITIEAADGVRFGAGSFTAAAGFTLQAPGGFTPSGAAGRIDVQARRGAIELMGTLDVSAAGSGDAGAITLNAPGEGGTLAIGESAQLKGHAGSGDGDRGGRLDVDLARLPNADAIARAAREGGLSGSFSLRVRQGDLALSTALQSQRIQLAADEGALAIGGVVPMTLDARAPAGGVVQLAAGGDLRLADGVQIDARSTRSGANGGDVLLSSTEGRLRLMPGAGIDAGGDDAQDGRIVLRAGRGADGRSVRIDPLTPAKLVAAEVAIEAVQRYEQVDTLAAFGDDPGVLALPTVLADNVRLLAARPTLLSALGLGAAVQAEGRFRLRPGVEVRAEGDLTVVDDWNFSGSGAGFLTLRAAGQLFVSGSLSDGFTAAGTLGDTTQAWSFRLAAGADLSGANPLALQKPIALAADSGSLTIDGGKVVRTGAGSIELAAARDIVFADAGDGSPAGSAYVAGRRLAAPAGLFAAQRATPQFSEQGGRLELSAGQDIVAPEATQFIGNWFWRSGLPSVRPGEAGLYAADSQLAWWTHLPAFGQTLGSFGGSSVWVQAGRDIVNLQAMVPSAGWADRRSAATAQLQTLDGGDLSVSAGRDLLGGQFFVGLGEGRLQAGRSIGAAADDVGLQVPALALMDGRWRATARLDADLLAPFNPTAAPASGSAGRSSLSPWFYSWGPQAELNVVANAGRLAVETGVDQSLFEGYGLDTRNDGIAPSFNVLPATLRATAAAGDLNIGGVAALMFPAPRGQLALYAGGDLLVPAPLSMADSAPGAWPTAAAPLGSALPLISQIANTTADRLPLAGLHQGDAEPVQVHAEGSLRIEGASRSQATLMLPKPALLSAGLDVTGLSLRGENLSAGDVTQVSAGRNLLAGDFGQIELAGPGLLAVSAGGSVDLGSSAGLATSGNLRNPGLPAQGASIRLAASTAGVLDLAALDAQFLEPPAQGGSPRYQQHRDALVAFVQEALKRDGLGFDAAWTAFRAFPAQAQAAFGRQVLASELVATYLAGPAPDAASVKAALQAAFEQRKADLLRAADVAIAAGSTLTLPGRETLGGAALAAYADSIRALGFDRLDIDATVASRVASLAKIRSTWGGLNETSGPRFEAFAAAVLASETADAGALAANFGRASLPMRMALFDQGFAAAEPAGAGSFVAQPIWPGRASLFAYAGALDMTQSSVITQRGGGIALVNPGGAINVGLKDDGAADTSRPKGVIALGGGDVFGFAKGDFQVNNQRVFIVGRGDMTIWSSSGDIDSGRGANTAVAAPPLQARRSVDGVVFEVPATTTGSGLGILEDATGRREGRIGLYPAFGEILALDAFIRAPALVLGAAVKGADNLIAASVGGAAAVVAAPSANVAPPAGSTAEARAADAQAGTKPAETRPRPSLLTVELLGLGAASDEPPCEERDAATGKCLKPAKGR